jgi:hypothetical protein
VLTERFAPQMVVDLPLWPKLLPLSLTISGTGVVVFLVFSTRRIVARLLRRATFARKGGRRAEPPNRGRGVEGSGKSMLFTAKLRIHP